jgi:endogenous inhibitor of DNA gyrase (YacG/DUF329 family)
MSDFIICPNCKERIEVRNVKSTICEKCGKIIYYFFGRPPKYCLECTGRDEESLTNRNTRTCKECGKQFQITPSQGKPPQFCSEECRAKHLIEYRKKYYGVVNEYKPAKPLTRDQYTKKLTYEPCIRCGKTPAGATVACVNLHDEFENFLPACEACNNKFFQPSYPGEKYPKEGLWSIEDVEDKVIERDAEQYLWIMEHTFEEV